MLSCAVGEEIEMTPMIFTKGLAEPGFWGDKFFGRIMIEEAHLGEGCFHKACRVKVIYGMEPVFESGSTCIIKVQSPIAYSSKDESSLAERNLEITKQASATRGMSRQGRGNKSMHVGRPCIFWLIGTSVTTTVERP